LGRCLASVGPAGQIAAMIPAFKVELDQLEFVGSGIERPECVLVTRSGHICAADWRGGVTVLDGTGQQRLIKAHGEIPERGLKPNGIALCRDGSFLITHLDEHDGGVYRMSRDGRLDPYLLEIEGKPLPPTNFVHVDAVDRVWITVSTRHIPRTLARSPKIADGYVILMDGNGARIVADGIGYTNEAKVDPSGRWLYINETFGCRISRYPIRDDSSLGPREIFTRFDGGVFPDGLDFDQEGGLWLTSVFSNRLIRIAPDGQHHIVLEDTDPSYLADFERDYLSGALIDRPADKVPSRLLGNISSVAFGGADLRTVYLGCLQDTRIATFRSPVAGVKPAHWTYL
jgi:sugar lactone lactonase YvrE